MSSAERTRAGVSFRDGQIEDVVFSAANAHSDHRGWLVELFRVDEMDEPLHPQMAYVSQTLPGVTRGPHEHREQTDLFVFFGPGDFQLYCWDTRPHSTSWRVRQVALVGQSNPQRVLVPPGVVHAYRNISSIPGLVFNAPNQLYAGRGKRSPVDEIRYEDDAHSGFVID